MTLLEVMMSLLLLILCAAGSLGMMMVTVRANAFAGSVQTATKVGQHIIDQMMMESYDTLGVGNSSCKNNATLWETVYANGTASSPGAGSAMPFERSCTITPLPNGLKIVRVQVRWKDSADDTRYHFANLGVQRAP